MRSPIGRPLVHMLLVVCILVLIPGCGDVSGAPTIPPKETFVIDFEAFTDNDTGALVSVTGARTELPPSSLAIGDQSHWNYAALNVGFWRLLVAVGLAVPVAAFSASFRNIPLRQEDGSWIWSYSVRVGGSVHSAELHGQFIEQGVRWDMRISKEGEYEDFLWYYGESDLPATDGFWILKESPENPSDLLRIDWSRNIEEGTNAIRYMNIVPGGAENGGYIDAQYTVETPYDHIWDIYNKGQDNHTYIEWSSSTDEGRVKDLTHFGDDDWHCWDSDHQNIACP